jgi:hypothetical protein
MNIGDFVRQRVNGYPQERVQLAEGLYFNEYETKRRIHFYSNSAYETGPKDDLGREKPFYNVSKWRLQVAVRSTDLDTKNVQIIADHEDGQIPSMLLNRRVYNWMKDEDFALKLNEMGYARGKWGGVLVKKYTKRENGKKKLCVDVCDWRNVVTDPIDVMSGAIVEMHDLSPTRLAKMGKTWNDVDRALDLASKTRTSALGGDSEGSTDKVRVYEVTGEFPRSYFDEDADGYAVYHCYLAGVDEGEEIVLFSEELDSVEDKYRYLAWEKVEGRGMGVGVIEDGFEAQAWTNDAVQKERDMLELASKIFYKTDDPSIDDNSLTDLQTGQIIKVEDGKTFAQVNTVPVAFPQIQETIAKWDRQYERVSNTFAAVTGESMPARTPFRAIATMNQEGSSFFRYRLEEFGIFVGEIIEDWVVPHCIETMEDSLTAEFSGDELAIVDDAIASEAATEEIIRRALAPVGQFEPMAPEEPQAMKDAALKALGAKPPKRTVRIPKGFFDGIEYKVTVDVTGEAIDKATTLESLNNILITVAQNPAVLTDPVLKKLFGKAVELAGVGVSPEQFQVAATSQMTGPTAPGSFTPASAGTMPGNAAPAQA